MRNGRRSAGTRSASTANDLEALLGALRASRQVVDGPHAIVLDTLMGKGVPLFEKRDKNHFIRVESGDWETARKQLEERSAGQ